MSLHYILDGYNILKQVSRFSDTKLKQGRLDFISLLFFSSRLKKQEVVVVFDGYQDTRERLPVGPNMKIIFSKDGSADDKIRNLLEHAANPRQVVVVSDDKEVRFFSRLAKAHVLSVAQFLALISGSQAGKRHSCAKTDSEDKNLSYKQVLDINKELKKVWLGEDAD